MNTWLVARAAVGLTLATALSGMATAQAWTPGAEITGQAVQVTTNGTTNTVYLDQGGVARIMTPSGNTINGTWGAANGQLCLNNGTAQECWPYTTPFQAGQPLTLTSSCNATSTWLAAATNTAAPAPAPQAGGERGK
ncbi:hypothetical protein ACUXST_000433 [Sphingomonas sp. F9_3S_D5_B_2]